MTRVKICGLRREEDARCVNDCMPDFAGFVFAPGKRQVDAGAGARLRDILDPRIQTVGVFVNQDPRWIAELCRAGVVNLVQLHGDEGDEDVREIKERAGGVPVIRVVRVGTALPPLPAADYLLFDTLAAARGGTGRSFDWGLVRGVRTPFFLAGGLHPGNVARAIAAVRPACVDVSSGVETQGVKDPAKIAAFMERVRG